MDYTIWASSLCPPEQRHITQHNHVKAINGTAGVASFSSASSNSASEVLHECAVVVRKRTARNTACDECHVTKRKCTDPRPCQGCQEKGIACNKPAPKSDTKVLDSIAHATDLANEVKRLNANIISEITLLRDDVRMLGSQQEILAEALYPYNVFEESENSRISPSHLEVGGDFADSNDGTEHEAPANAPLAEPATPIGHTTGATNILRWQSVAAMVGEKINGGVINPMERERRRGTIRLYGDGEARPEANRRSLGIEMDSISDYSPKHLGFTDTCSDPAQSTAVEQDWGQCGAQGPVSDSFLYHAKSDVTQGLDELTVRYLAGIYMRHLNIMHLVISPKSLEGMISRFMHYIRSTEGDGAGCNNVAALAASDATSTKGKPSPTTSHTFSPLISQGLRQCTISEGIVLLILALGKICEHHTKIPVAAPELTSNPTTNHTTTTNLTNTQYSPGTRNDDIPGLVYFTAAMQILGSCNGGMGLPYVYAWLLAGLYHNQLGRVLQSHACIKEAGYTLCIMLGPHLERYKKMQEKMQSPDPDSQDKSHIEDNRKLFAFWTCLQLESDIVAELDVPQSDILRLESMMPWPSLDLAARQGEVTQEESRFYLTHAMYCKKINTIHRDLYGPGGEDIYQLEHMNAVSTFPYISEIFTYLKSVLELIPSPTWNESNTPSLTILKARLLAKNYYTEVIATRHFLRMVLNSQYDGNKHMKISGPIMELAQRCIYAMLGSMQAFWGIRERMVVLTNVWETAHVQWGHVIVLHAAYRDPRLRPCVTQRTLLEMTVKVRDFLVSVAHPRSSLTDDIRILDYATKMSGLEEDVAGL
ncbi:hypothetical protein V494_00250 [Pseudogymnoascus sp. VKM F-4513 (FW-928)]|nr:hypothetical protein V494_00250 [Pseudogymnoascus sp. VKM F-4513 (FW-928)]